MIVAFVPGQGRQVDRLQVCSLANAAGRGNGVEDPISLAQSVDSGTLHRAGDVDLDGLPVDGL